MIFESLLLRQFSSNFKLYGKYGNQEGMQAITFWAVCQI